ncbi:MAG: FtsX-like permease family protein [Chthoniobacteraceae bacterium]
MSPWIQIAARSLARNRRRSLFTLLAIAFGFAAVNIFAGFTEYMFVSLRDAFIYAQGNGHLTIFKKGFLTEGQIDPKNYLLTDTDLATIKEVCQANPHTLTVTPKLLISGMISNGKTSTIAIANGVVPSDITAINKRATGTIGRAKLFTGQPLDDKEGFGVGVGTALAKKLKLDLGSDAVIMSPTVDGQMNALDIKILQTFDAPVEALNDKLMIIPLSLAQNLYDTKGADRVCVLLDDKDQTDIMRDELTRALAAKGIPVEIRTWYEISDMYERTKKMFDIIFLFLFIIVMGIVVMSVVNTVGMSVMERIQEIGTLRALGVKRFGILKLFALESGLLGAAGCLAGVILTLISWTSIKLAGPSWVPPAISRRVPLEVYLVPRYLIISFACLILLSILAAVFPARKAACSNIVESLGHV